ncbi:MAG: hypothetical protein PHX83_09405 [Acidobacteriia bacterium]|nr:hypothetical protein [Terriglobia bacterium]
MRKLLWLGLVAILVMPLSLLAQDYPKAEIFGGYSFQHVEGGTNLNGWNASLAGNLNNWLGVVADFGGYYGDFNDHTFMFGPQISYRGDERFTPFFHALFGGAHDSGGLLEAKGSTAFAMAIGGGIDYNASKNFAVRIIQVDYLMTRFNIPGGSHPNTQNNARVSVGIVGRF